jgi:hypothetical protein
MGTSLTCPTPWVSPDSETRQAPSIGEHDDPRRVGKDGAPRGQSPNPTRPAPEPRRSSAATSPSRWYVAPTLDGEHAPACSPGAIDASHVSPRTAARTMCRAQAPTSSALRLASRREGEASTILSGPRSGCLRRPLRRGNLRRAQPPGRGQYKNCPSSTRLAPPPLLHAHSSSQAAPRSRPSRGLPTPLRSRTHLEDDVLFPSRVRVLPRQG